MKLRTAIALWAVCGAGATLSSGEVAPPFDYRQIENPPAPAPDWAKHMIDLGTRDPALKGYRAPAGVKLEVVAQEPDVINPVGMRFLEDGTLVAIEWRIGNSIEFRDEKITLKDGSQPLAQHWVKDVTDDLKALAPVDNGKTFGNPRVLMDDLQLPSSVLHDDGWFYFTTRGGVTRRRQSPGPAPGSKFDVQERTVQGLAGFNQHQASGLTLSPDGWLFTTNGDDDSHAEGSDGKRASLLRTGGVWRMRPDGSNLTLFARGFRNPYRDVVFDDFYNIFHADNDNEDGSKFMGCRLINVMEEADYGWRLKPGVRCCVPDYDRGAIFGERAGRMPPMIKTGRGAPAGVLMYFGTALPEKLFRGLIIYPDVFQRNVRAYRVARDGSTFKVVEQFDLITTDDPYFRPCQAITGPDGAIYLCDWRSNSAGPGAAWGDGKHGRIWRITWEGSAQVPDAPAIARGAIDAWATARQGDAAALLARLDTPDAELRRVVLDELVHCGDSSRGGLLQIAGDAHRPAPTRAAAISGACRLWNDAVRDALIQLLSDPNPELRRLSADLLSRNAPQPTPAIIAAMQKLLADPQPMARRSAALALGHFAAMLPEGDPARAALIAQLFAALRQDDRSDRFLHDGFLRGLERMGASGMKPLSDAALSDAPADREFGVSELESLRTREAGEALDRVVSAFDKSALTGEQRVRILTAYRYIQTDPGPDPSVLSTWLENHPNAPGDQQVAAMQSVAAMGQMNPAPITAVVMRLLDNPAVGTRLAAMKIIGEQRLLTAAPALLGVLSKTDRPVDEKRAAIGALSQLRAVRNSIQIDLSPGVDGLVEQLAALVADPACRAIRIDVLTLLAQVNYPRARPEAEKLLESGDAPACAAAISILAPDPAGAKLIAERFIDGKLPRELLPQVAAALQRHITEGKPDDLVALRSQVMKSGLVVATDPAGVKRIEDLVHARGNAMRGKALFLNQQKLACITCHRLEGIGGQIGPDLTNLYQNSSTAKLIESILEPSKEIKEGFETYIIATKSGQTYDGLRVSSDVNRTVLRDSQGKEIAIPAGDIRKMVVSKISLMPEGLTATLSLDEFADLLAFLGDAKAQATLRPATTQR